MCVCVCVCGVKKSLYIDSEYLVEARFRRERCNKKLGLFNELGNEILQCSQVSLCANRKKVNDLCDPPSPVLEYS